MSTTTHQFEADTGKILDIVITLYIPTAKYFCVN